MLDKLKGWIPDRKVWLGGLSAILAWYVLHLAAQYGFDPQPIIHAIWSLPFLAGQPEPAAQPLLAGLIAAAIAYGTPASAKDIIKKIDDDIAKEAGYLPAPPAQQPKPQPTVAAASKAS